MADQGCSVTLFLLVEHRNVEAERTASVTSSRVSADMSEERFRIDLVTSGLTLSGLMRSTALYFFQISMYFSLCYHPCPANLHCRNPPLSSQNTEILLSMRSHLGTQWVRKIHVSRRFIGSIYCLTSFAFLD